MYLYLLKYGILLESFLASNLAFPVSLPFGHVSNSINAVYIQVVIDRKFWTLSFAVGHFGSDHKESEP